MLYPSSSSSSPNKNKARAVRFDDQVEIVRRQYQQQPACTNSRTRQSGTQIQMIPSALFNTLPMTTTAGDNADDDDNDDRRHRWNSNVITRSSNGKIVILESVLQILSAN